ncbi:hypothetical protein D3C74_264770 [compost metagenome]
MKKQIIIASLSTILILGGGGLIYSYAAEAKVDDQAKNETNFAQSEQITENDSKKLPEIKAEKVEDLPGAIDISEIPAEEILIPRSVSENASNDAQKSLDTNISLKETEILARNTEYGYVLRTTYYTQAEAEIVFFQAPLTKDKDLTIESLKDSYKAESVELTEINGYSVVYVDGIKRKVVHLITDNHLFTASTIDGSLEDLLNIIGQIKE